MVSFPPRDPLKTSTQTDWHLWSTVWHITFSPSVRIYNIQFNISSRKILSSSLHPYMCLISKENTLLFEEVPPPDQKRLGNVILSDESTVKWFTNMKMTNHWPWGATVYSRASQAFSLGQKQEMARRSHKIEYWSG